MNFLELDDQAFELHIRGYPADFQDELRAMRIQSCQRIAESKLAVEEAIKRAEEAEERLSNLQLQTNLTSGTATQTYVTAMKNGTRINSFPWRNVPRNTLIQLWDDLKVTMPVWDENSRENDVIHEVMKRVLTYLSEALGVNVIFHMRPTIAKVSPDFVGTSLNVVYPSWSDVIFLVEMKAARADMMKEAVGQAIKYMLTEFTLFESERIGFGSNLISIQFIHFVPRLKDFGITLILPLFPDKWREMQPTIGFAMLCQMLYYPLPAIKVIEIDGAKVPVASILYETSDIGIYAVSIGENLYVAKIGFTKITSSMIKYVEPAKYQVVSAIQGMSEYMVPIYPQFNVSDGFLMALAKPICEWEGDLRIPMLHIFKGLRIMHDKNVYHLDIRPRNIVIFNETARLIDWITSINHQPTASTLMQGKKDYFWPTDPEAYRNYPALWDILGFAYTFFFLGSDMDTRKSFYDIRDATVASFTSEISVKGAAAGLVSYIEDLGTSNFDYNAALNILTRV